MLKTSWPLGEARNSSSACLTARFKSPSPARGTGSGFIEYAHNWTMRNVRLLTANGEPLKITNSRNVDTPEVRKQ